MILSLSGMISLPSRRTMAYIEHTSAAVPLFQKTVEAHS